MIDNYCLSETRLDIVEDIRDLGTQVDSKLKFHAHTDIITKKEYKDSDVIAKLYNTFVQPFVEYRNNLWGLTYILDNQKLEKNPT